MALRTGHGSTITMSGFTSPVIMIGASELTRPVLDKSHLGTTDYREKIPGDLVDEGEFDVEFFWDPTLATMPPITGAAVSVTITIVGAATNDATLAGTAFFTMIGTPELATDNIMRSRARMAWADGPTWTPES